MENSNPTLNDYLTAQQEQDKLIPIIKRAELEMKRNSDLFQNGLLSCSDFIKVSYYVWLDANDKASSGNGFINYEGELKCERKV